MIYKYTNNGFTPNERQDLSDSYTVDQTDSPYSRYDSGPSVLSSLAVGLGAVALSDAYVARTGASSDWEVYTALARNVEIYSPGKILRTFQVSDFISQFQDRPSVFMSPEQLAKEPLHAQYLERLITNGQDSEILARIFAEGITVSGGKAYWGTGTEVALEYARIMTAPRDMGANLGAAYAQSLGMSEDFLQSGIRPSKFFSYLGAEEEITRGFSILERGQRLPFQVVGGKTSGEVSSRVTGALWTESVGRFNRLLGNQGDIPVVGKAVEKVSQIIKEQTGFSMAVKEGTGTEMFGGLLKKYAFGLTALGLGYATVDYAVRHFSPLNGTIWDEGLSSGVGQLWGHGQIAVSAAQETLGLHDYRETQEQTAPGSTSLQRLLGIPLSLGFAGTIAGYIGRSAQIRNAQQQGKAIETAYRTVSQKLDTDIFKGISPIKMGGLAGLAIGGLAILPYLPGALISSQRPVELESMYSGETSVGIRKGRWWEMGRSPYEGGKIQYFRPHAVAAARMRSKEKALWGDDEPWPISKFFIKEFTYGLERMHEADRPYPITGTAFEDIPLIGPILSGTIGRIIKPPKLMHQGDWQRGGAAIPSPLGFGEQRVGSLGETGGATPISPYSPTGVIGEQAYRFTEMTGLPGFALSSLKEAMTGTPDLFDTATRFQSSREMFGVERDYWERDIGGGLGLTEPLRRFFPHKRRQIPTYNPIRNTMPSWMTGDEDKGIDFMHGDPYTKVKFGEMRLPGKGYEARYPELEGTDPEQYPLIHRYRILADVARFSDKYKKVAMQIAQKRKSDTWSEYEEKMYQQVRYEVKAKRESELDNHEYQYLSESGELFGDETHYSDSSAILKRLNEDYRDQREGDRGGISQRLFGGYWELLSHNTETALDFLTPISPASKLTHMRSAREAYERTQAYGTSNAFWNAPLENFIIPAARVAGKQMLNLDELSSELEKKRAIESYFDTLKYVKFARLERMAASAHDINAAKKFSAKKQETLFGINPYSQNYTGIYRALPGRDRPFFQAFSSVQTEEEKSKILSIIPDNEKALYSARWKMKLAAEINEVKENGGLSFLEGLSADKTIAQINKEAKYGGMPVSESLLKEYEENQLKGERYADWYRRTYLLPQMPKLPGADWLGWDERVDLEDVKMHLIMTQGEDMHDYDLWPSRLQQLQFKPFINDDIIDPIINLDSTFEVRKRAVISDLLNSGGMGRTSSLSFLPSFVDQTEIDIQVSEDDDGFLGVF